MKMNKNVENNNEVVTINRNDLIVPDMINGLTDTTSAFFSSIVDDGSRKSKIAIYNAISKDDEKLDDHKGEILKIKDIVAHTVTLADEESGEVLNLVRIILIDDKGVGYASISQGVYSSIQKIFAIVGMPTWDEPMKLKCVEQKTRKGFKTLTLELVD